MKSVYEVLREKESTAQRIRSEIGALRLLVPLLVTESTDGRSATSDYATACIEPTPDKVAQQIEALRIAGPLLLDETEDLASKIRAMRVKAVANDAKFARVINSLWTILRIGSFRKLSQAIHPNFDRR